MVRVASDSEAIARSRRTPIKAKRHRWRYSRSWRGIGKSRRRLVELFGTIGSHKALISVKDTGSLRCLRAYLGRILFAMPTIEDVREFWDANPLWTGEAGEAAGSKEFFNTHTQAVINMAGGHIKPWMMPSCSKDGTVLDLGCGIGFWLEYFGRAGFTNLTGADLSPNSLSLAQRRCELNSVNASFSIQNAEAMTFADNTFDHINCSGVIHHSPNPQASINEIYRVLKPGGQAVIGVYYKNALLRVWPVLRFARHALPSLKGRGRETMLESSSSDELVRLFDGVDNPIGKSFSRREFEAMLPAKSSFHYSAFPARILPVKLTGRALSAAEWMMPFLISAVIEKR